MKRIIQDAAILGAGYYLGKKRALRRTLGPMIGGIGKLPRLKKVEFWAKEWFHKSAGNSYFVVKVFVNDKFVGQSDSMEYGYGDQYQVAGMKILKSVGYLRGVNLNKIPGPKRYFRERGVKTSFHKNDVKRERDLKAFLNEDIQ